MKTSLQLSLASSLPPLSADANTMTGNKIYFGVDLNISFPLSAKRYRPAWNVRKTAHYPDKLEGQTGAQLDVARVERGGDIAVCGRAHNVTDIREVGVVEDVEEFAANSQLGSLADGEIPIEIEGHVVGSAGSADDVAAFIAKCSQRLKCKCVRIEITEHVSCDVQRSDDIGALRAAADARAVARNGNREGEAAGETCVAAGLPAAEDFAVPDVALFEERQIVYKIQSQILRLVVAAQSLFIGLQCLVLPVAPDDGLGKCIGDLKGGAVVEAAIGAYLQGVIFRRGVPLVVVNGSVSQIWPDGIDVDFPIRYTKIGLWLI